MKLKLLRTLTCWMDNIRKDDRRNYTSNLRKESKLFLLFNRARFTQTIIGQKSHLFSYFGADRFTRELKIGASRVESQFPSNYIPIIRLKLIPRRIIILNSTLSIVNNKIAISRISDFPFLYEMVK